MAGVSVRSHFIKSSALTVKYVSDNIRRIESLDEYKERLKRDEECQEFEESEDEFDLTDRDDDALRMFRKFQGEKKDGEASDVGSLYGFRTFCPSRRHSIGMKMNTTPKPAAKSKRLSVISQLQDDENFVAFTMSQASPGRPQLTSVSARKLCLSPDTPSRRQRSVVCCDSPSSMLKLKFTRNLADQITPNKYDTPSTPTVSESGSVVDTPYNLRRRIARNLENMFYESDSDDDISNDGSSSDAYSDGNKENERGSSSSFSEDEDSFNTTPYFASKRTPLKNIGSSCISSARRLVFNKESEADESLSSNPRRSKILRRVHSEIQTQTGTDEYFTAHGANSKCKTSDRTLSSLNIPRMSQEDLRNSLSNQKIRHSFAIKQLLDECKERFYKWKLYLECDFNVILYGLGSKRSLIEEFRCHFLEYQTNSDFVVVNGFFPSLTIKDVLTNITEDIIGQHDGIGGSLNDQLEFIRSYYAKKNHHSPLYLMIHNIDGIQLRNERSQDILSLLACCPGIHVICSIDHINAPLLWDHARLRRFNFVWQDATTFLPYIKETADESSLMIRPSGALALSSLNHVFASLTSNAKGIYLLIAKWQLENSADTASGLAMSELYRMCREAFLVNSNLTLNAQLTEFVDHKLIKSKKATDDGVERVSIPLPVSTLKIFVDSQSVLD